MKIPFSSVNMILQTDLNVLNVYVTKCADPWQTNRFFADWLV